MTLRRRQVKVLGAMVWLRRSVVLIPVISFVAAVLLLSCGGGGGSSTSSSSPPNQLRDLRICAGSPPTPTPTAVPTKGCPPPHKTPTPECNPPTPVAGATFVQAVIDPGQAIQFNAQGAYSVSAKGKKSYRDVTSDLSLSWGIGPSPVIQATASPDGQFIGVSNGCACLTALIGNVLSCPVTIQVGTPGVSCDSPQLCPTPTTTPSPGSKETSVALCPGPTVTPSKTPTPNPKCATPTLVPTAAPT